MAMKRSEAEKLVARRVEWAVEQLEGAIDKALKGHYEGDPVEVPIGKRPSALVAAALVQRFGEAGWELRFEDRPGEELGDPRDPRAVGAPRCVVVVSGASGCETLLGSGGASALALAQDAVDLLFEVDVVRGWSDACANWHDARASLRAKLAGLQNS